MAFDPAKNPPSSEAAHKLIGEIAKLIGCEATHDAVDKAMQILFAAVAGDDEGSDQLTESEKVACKDAGCSPREFLRLKKSQSLDGFLVLNRRQATAAGSIRR